ncbi:MAG: hypothetical protein ACOX52_07365 [Verrucomicrobiota bacterium]
MEPTHPDRLVENVTAPSAGGFPGPDGEVSRRDRRGRRGVLGGGKRDHAAAIMNGRFNVTAQRCIGRGGKGPTSEPFSTTGLVN